MIPYIMASFGILLIFLEFYLPGAILGISGAFLLLFSYFALIREGAGPIEILLFILVTIGAVTLLIRYLLWAIPREKRGIYLSGDQAGYVSSTFDKNAIGKKGIVATDLKPGGFIIVNGSQQAAISLSGYIEKGNQVFVISGEGDSLLVKGIDLSKDRE